MGINFSSVSVSRKRFKDLLRKEKTLIVSKKMAPKRPLKFGKGVASTLLTKYMK